jgi:hypothetical protein
MTKAIQTLNGFGPLASRVSILVDAAVRTVRKLADDRARAQRAAILAGLPRQRLSELRALYTEEAIPVRSQVQPRCSVGFRAPRCVRPTTQ